MVGQCDSPLAALGIRVTEPSKIRWFEKFDIRSSNIEPSNHSWIFDHRTGSIIDRFDQGFDIRWFDRSYISRVRYKVRYSRRFGGSIFDGSIDKVRYSMRFDGSIFDGSIDRISQGFDKVRYSILDYRTIEYIRTH